MSDITSPTGDENGRPPANRTIGATRQLANAVAGDVGSFFKGVGKGFARLGRGAFRRRGTIGTLLSIMAAGVAAVVIAIGIAMMWVLYDLPVDERFSSVDGPSLVLEASNGEPLGRVGALKGGDLRRQDFPDQLVNAVLSSEDRRFYTHRGIDLWGIARASLANFSAGGIVEGGSTVTQQLVKIGLVGRERTMNRKVREALTAVWLEYRLGKDEILTRYLNRVYLGAGAYGMAAGARRYFDKSLPQLTLAESAMLAGLIKAPSKYSPMRSLEVAQQQAAVVVDAMLETGVIDAKAAAEAKARPATLKPSLEVARSGTWFADWIGKDEFSKVFGAPDRNMRVRTTLVPELQRMAEQTVADIMKSGDKMGATQAALVAMRPDGSVVAMVGGRNYEDSQFNRAADAKRQPGSAFKLFVYLAALRKGYSIHDSIDASPVQIKNWEPENSGGGEYGHVPMTEAFARSLNTAAVRLAMDVGLDKVVAAARDLGIEAPLPAVPSIALGTSEVSLINLTGAFASVRSGRKVQPWGVTAFGTDDKTLRPLGAPSATGPALAYQAEMTELLRGVVDHGTGRSAALGDGPAAGKTGTSQDYRDAWFVGFNDSLVVGVWVGNDDHAPMQGVTGGSLPARIWQRFVSKATPVVERTNRDRMISRPSMALTAMEPYRDRDRERTDMEQRVSAETETNGRCNPSACAHYRSFRESDCTYQPHSGPRRLCTRADRGERAERDRDRERDRGYGYRYRGFW